MRWPAAQGISEAVVPGRRGGLQCSLSPQDDRAQAAGGRRPWKPAARLSEVGQSGVVECHDLLQHAEVDRASSIELVEQGFEGCPASAGI